MPVVMSEKYRKYFEKIETDVDKIYQFAEKARSIGIDPDTVVESPQARDMAGRVEKLVGPEGIADLLRSWKEAGADQDELCFRSMDWLIEDKLGTFTPDEKVDRAIRLALAIKTEGVVSAPLEGIAKVIIRDNKAGGDPYLALYFAGPIRAAGGTVQAFAVLCAEHVRQKMNIPKWVATEDEVGRFIEEVKLYDRIMNLQYPSTHEELAFAVRHLTVELNGDPTEKREVSAHRDLPRIDTNFVRGGPCLVLNDGVLLKSKKILRVIDKRKIPEWEWLLKLKKLAQAKNEDKLEDNGKDKALDYGGDTYKGKKRGAETDTKSKDESELSQSPSKIRRQKLDAKNPPLNKYIADIIAGRPVFAYPSQVGGQRIRYGRSRNTGLAACGTHPSQMILLEKFMAIGTQIRIERPGKSSSTMPVTSIEPPIVLLKNGDVKQLWDAKDAGNIQEHHSAESILFLGDILFGYGEFVENNHTIIPSGYVEEWWAVELEAKIGKIKKNGKDPYENLSEDLSSVDVQAMIADPFANIPSAKQALHISITYQTGIHPRYLDHWGNIDGIDLLAIRETFSEGLRQAFSLKDEKLNSHGNFSSLEKLSLQELEKAFAKGLEIPMNTQVKQALIHAFVVHKQQPSSLWLEPDRALIFFHLLGFGSTHNISKNLGEVATELTALELFSHLTTIIVPDKAPYYMGSRMGRPEKAKERKMKPPVHSLFPIGHDSKLQRSFQNAIGVPKIDVEICQKICPSCKTVTFLNICPKCQTHTQFQKICPRCKAMFDLEETECSSCRGYLKTTSQKSFSLKRYFETAAAKIPKTIPTIKGVKGMSSEYKVPEPIEKGILRAINDVYVYKDGTIRADATDIPLTHFTCKEINTPVAKILELGYDLDVNGDPITDENQIIEIKVQDVLLTHHLGDYFINVANFVDDELEYLYKQPRFYNIKDKYDLIGHYMVGLAPHTSAGIIGRLIGFTYAESGYAHPYWHSAKRRNCFPKQSKITIKENGYYKQITFEELYNNYFDLEIKEELGYAKTKPLKDVQILAFDTKTKQISPAKIKRVVKVPSTDHLIRFLLRSGRKFEVTPNHEVIIVRDKKVMTLKALEVKKGDHFILPHLNIPAIDIDEIDLLAHYATEKYKDMNDIIMVRGIRDFTKKITDKHGLKVVAEFLQINKKTLFNYYSKRDSIPLSILIRLLDFTQQKFEDVPDCFIGFKQDHTYIPRVIKFDSYLMKLLGYYLSEGFSRSNNHCNQVDIAATETDLREDILLCIEKTFGNGFKPYINEIRITMSSHAIYSFFNDVLGLEHFSRNKSIPLIIKNLPLEKISPMLSAYFSGDGSVDPNHEINCSSFSRKLIEDLDFLLLRFNIFGNIYSFERDGNIEYKIRFYGQEVKKFSELIGFTSKRKQKAMFELVNNQKIRDLPMFGKNKLLAIKEIQTFPSPYNQVYSVELESFHSLLINEFIVTHNCDGDEDGIMLLLECLLNFSLYYLPSSLGGKMDAPLVISLLLDPREVDGESHNVDYMSRYPLQFYLDSQTYCKPKLSYMKLFTNYLGTNAQFEGSNFTHPTKSINFGPRKSMYSVYETMAEKIDSQLYLAKTIEAVKVQDVARKVISSHFAPDILGNLRAFSTQSFRCPKCGTKFRRTPLIGRCTKCGNDILMTVHPGGITKYLSKAQSFIKEFDLGAYTEQRWKIIARNVKDVTDNPRIKQKSIVSFFK